jgi:hypothetical protein
MDQNRAKEYVRLPGKGRRRGSFFTVTGGSSTLWAGPDHLLCINSNGYADEYKRFYYREIQGLITRKTVTSTVSNIVCGCLAGIMVVLALLIGGVGVPVFLSLAGAMLALLAINLWKGPSCVTHIRTAVQLDELPSLNRIKRVRQVMALVLPSIEQAQGRLTSEEVQSGLVNLQVQSLNQPAVAAKPPPLISRSVYHGRLHLWLFYVVLAHGLASAVFSSKSVLLNGIFSVFSSAVLILCLIALARQSGAALKRGVKPLAWSVLAYMAVLTALGFVLMVVVAVQNPDRAQTELDNIRALAELTPFDSPFLMGVMLFSAIGGVVLGLAGIAAMRKAPAVLLSSRPPPAPVAQEKAE